MAAAKKTKKKPVPALVGPKRKPALKEGDYHLVINDGTETCKIFNAKGTLLRTLPALAKGVRGPSDTVQGGDTPPGLYRLGQLFRSLPSESRVDVWFPYGPLCWDMEELENQENSRGRSGICLHGGGSGAPDPLADYQVLLPTYGCVRMHNKDTRDHILPLTHVFKHNRWVPRGNTVYVSVYQDSK